MLLVALPVFAGDIKLAVIPKSAGGECWETVAKGAVKAVGIGSKDWRMVREIAGQVDLDWVMFACSLSVYSHPPELLDFIAHLHARGVGMINSAVFHAGFLTGGAWFDYRKPEPAHFAWRDKFFAICRRFDVKPADACVQFGLERVRLIRGRSNDCSWRNC
jgi:D-threo-aldose 1-dehydrogenase